VTVGALLAVVLVERQQPPGPSTSDTPPKPLLGGLPADVPGKPPCDQVTGSLTERQRLAQLLMVGVPGGNVDTAAAFARDIQLGGIFVHDNPAPLLTGGLARVHAVAHIPLAVAIDEEGGRVQTVDPLAGNLLSARKMAATMTPAQARTAAADRGRFLRAAGITMDFAPVVDVTDRPDNTVIGDRSFSSDPVIARTYAREFAAGLSSAGVLPVLKHFPGHGNAKGDSHTAMAVTPPLARLVGVDLVPYQGLSDYGPVAVMLGHLVVPGLTGEEPATLAPAAYQLLRDKYRFDGLVVTDDLGAMRAVTNRYDLPAAVLLALKAGADVALWSSGARVGEVLDRLVRAAQTGELPAERVRQALRHVLTTKGMCVP
jgi:beta-N-acetylhexosaminidase